MEEGYGLQERRQSKNVTHVEVLQVNSSRHLPLDVASMDLVKRRLKQRHIQICKSPNVLPLNLFDHFPKIAGTLGTGLFLGTGGAIHTAGPLGALIAFALVGSVAYSSLCSLGEMTSLAPISGSFPHFASRWVDPALGFAVSELLKFYVPVEISGAQILISMWDSHHAAVYTVVICIVICATNVFGVIYFGETEFALSILKLIMIIGLIIVGLVIDLGGAPNHQRLGFQYWSNPGVFAGPGLEPRYPALNNFLGILSAITQAAFAYQGMEIVAVAASETENPRRNIAKAIRRVFYRILIFYILGVFIAGLIVPSNNPQLLEGTGIFAKSPFVIAMQISGIRVLPAVVNAGFITSAFSAGNSFLFCSSRILYGLALRKQAPRFLTICTRKGVPIVAVLCSSVFAFLSLMSISSGAETVFTWFQHLSVMGGFFGWLSINLTYIFFYRGLQYQGIERQKLHYYNPLQPWLSIWGMVWCILFILINGFTVFWDFEASSFLTSYINIPLFFGLFLFWKVTRGTVVWKTDEMDFITGIPSCEETERPEIPPKGFWQHVAAVLF
ncbi:amino acid permease/ SLC12A domain-containing protein [Suillus plorans]|uniref:Amino acid permease/ SLC12A domain-containing protein n=1 Tax=Suillus plorans TaxID=116603 RepID=A0A9P7AQJ7_9AGAM|nr:amino acid permease/ SLC12A domain-containing protein [Suillus plorans]KAG1794453.1 amino acid permease/ SLC12A domain-containing protein [Suillus plorans]